MFPTVSAQRDRRERKEERSLALWPGPWGPLPVSHMLVSQILATTPNACFQQNQTLFDLYVSLQSTVVYLFAAWLFWG